ncbi:hypothetical protein F3I27_02705 [Pantoea sp. Bo_2]|uniref:Uncharacterized protein n=1 Tax=Candidatus Pantoea gossypiicola TaxID=2608008 RepID=A0AB34CR37_9GAMM|nr:hypothetical protein F3I59_00460 [Pantoea sp. VH_8]KAA5938505.1 hypothetical protein F3I58_01145 [Pantoea sp. VH_4]KAA5949909.1 hypothetical protein F3I57_02680 [Pantoea sp. VH_3]KAA5953408.1 hypothetical protein F3I55_16255 [Pantoea sp. VH_24]KAA5954118.1 hypothetical protein F3I56_07585 [Pantoea sp. VH_25]KAA5959936.1 hypothetical protein F3I53_12265 [Pantoea sp. VH_16]KAA5968809.1 hypothetical protein F3I54_00350 [Pantoea sp. VH_18]KAA5984407.1 hypothetical protein F3I48_04685 [Pantoea
MIGEREEKENPHGGAGRVNEVVPGKSAVSCYSLAAGGTIKQRYAGVCDPVLISSNCFRW